MTYVPPVNGGRINATIGGNTAGVGALVSTGTMTLAGGNNITLSQAGNAITISGANAGAGVAGTNTIGMSNIGNTSGTSGMVTGTGMQFAFAGGNNVTLSQSINASSGTITVSAANQTVQTQNVHNLTLSGNTAGVMAQVSSGTLTLAGGNNITLSQAGNAVTISGGAGGGGAAFSAGISNIGNTSGTSGTVSNQIIFAGGNQVTLSQSTAAGGNTVTISAAPMLDVGVSNLGNTLGNTGSNTNGVVLAGGNSITLSQSTDTAGATVTISGPSAITLSTFEPYPIHNTGTAVLSHNTNTSGAASFIPMVVDQYVAAGYINLIHSVNLTTGSTSSYNQSATMQYGLYTRGTGANSTTLSQITSGSWSYQVSYNNSSITVSQPTVSSTSGFGYGSTTSAGLNLSSQYTGLKMVQLPISSVLSPGNYYLGLFARASTSSFNSGLLMSNLGNAYSLGVLAPLGSLSSAYSSGTNVVAGNGNWFQGFGSYTSAGQTNLPSTVAISQLSQNIAVIPYMKFVVS